ncbi:MAG: hypothetical protein JJE25_13650 [Bacteroidia bacterium]|nr:hypothetical protein [Bacteroidia bacterium]
MKPLRYHYFRGKLLNSSFRFEFDGLKDFHRFIEYYHIKTFFVIDDEAHSASFFAVNHEGGLLQQSTLGFHTLEDFLLAEEHKFPDAASFYEAQTLGYSSYDEYKLVKEAGIQDKPAFEKMKLEGYVEGFTEFNAKKETLKVFSAAGNFKNPFELYTYSSGKGFASYNQFKDAAEKGFSEASIYSIATQQGYTSVADYEAGMKGGYINASDYKKAQELKVRDRKDFQKYIDLEFLHNTGCTHDQRVMLVLLSKLPQGKKVSVNKLTELHRQTVDEYRYEDTKEMPAWFTVSFDGAKSITEFLAQNDNVKKFGLFFNDGEYFETNLLHARSVVIDGSNVAHSSGGDEKAKPYVENIIKVVRELKKKGFVEITVITDASLKHRLVDKDKLPELRKICEYMEAPAENPADIFIIQYVKRAHCLLVSNDTFRDWKHMDSWVADNIDYYRLSFMIKGDTVLLPDLEIQEKR